MSPSPVTKRARPVGRPGGAVGRLTLLACAVLAPALAAQTGGVRFEVGGAQAFPPQGSRADAATYLLAGLQADRWWVDGHGLMGAVYGGKSIDTDGGDWVSGLVGGEVWLAARRPVAVGLTVQGYGFVVGEPFPYRAGVGQVSPEVRVRIGPLAVSLVGEAGAGRSRVELPLPRDAARDFVIRSDLWTYGGGPRILAPMGPGALALGAAVVESAAGTYRRASAEVYGSAGGFAWQAGVRAWHTPDGDELTGGLTVQIPVGGVWSLRGSFGRTEPDPLILAPPGDQGGLFLSVPLSDFSDRGPGLFELSEVDGEGRVRFSVVLPEASAVSVMGDFSLWEEIPMVLRDGRWVADVPTAPGIYHYGFLVDGEWYVPPGAPGRVSDEWGRTNATLVVP